MDDEIEARIDLITQMITSLGKLSNIEARLRWKGETAGADKVKAKHDELRDEIDILRGRVADQWASGIPQIEEGVRAANRKVQASIRNIRKNINVAENVVKVIGQADDAIVAIKGLIPA